VGVGPGVVWDPRSSDPPSRAATTAGGLGGIHSSLEIRKSVEVTGREAGLMDAWPTFVRACLDRHGVADVALAEQHGVSRKRYYLRSAKEGWPAPAPGVRLHPQASASVQRDLLVVCCSSRHPWAASGETAAWLHGLRSYPPKRPEVLGAHAGRASAHGRVTRRRARWLEADDIVERDLVPTLAVPAMFLSLAGVPPARLRAWMIDAIHRRQTTADEVRERVVRAGPVTGKHLIREYAEDLARRRVESIFQDEVVDELERLGYAPDRSTIRIPTADGYGLEVDIALRAWKVAVEPAGDVYHRDREQRRADRRRNAAFAGTDWVPVPVDWRDWHLDREHVLDSVDAAIDAQHRKGIGTARPRPVR
jgi:hypothetical protein